jgi:hypothetical protein
MIVKVLSLPSLEPPCEGLAQISLRSPPLRGKLLLACRLNMLYLIHRLA